MLTGDINSIFSIFTHRMKCTRQLSFPIITNSFSICETQNAVIFNVFKSTVYCFVLELHLIKKEETFYVQESLITHFCSNNLFLFQIQKIMINMLIQFQALS